MSVPTSLSFKETPLGIDCIYTLPFWNL